MLSEFLAVTTLVVTDVDQAKPFYEKLGYVQFAELQWPGSDLKRHFMRKAL